jgi:hypothetical protein
MTLALCVQLPSIFFLFPEIDGIPSLDGIPSCEGSLWLLANAVLAAINLITAFYLAFKVVNTDDPNMAHLDTTMKRVSYLLCHDCWIAIYICIFIGFFVLQCIGVAWTFSNDYDTNPNCNESVASNMRYANTLSWTYISGGFFAVMFAFCHATFDRQVNGNNNYNNQNNQNQYNVENPPPPQEQANAGYNTQGVPSNDIPVEASNTTYNAQGVPSNTAEASYESQGMPPNDFPSKGGKQTQQQQEPEIPMAYAEEIPQHASAPPAEYDNSPSTVNQQGDAQPKKPSTTGGNVGSKAGKQIGKLFTSNKATQQKMQKQGEKAGDAVEKGFQQAKKLLKSKMASKK